MLISIIVPVYNAAPYLDQCIQSILAQTYTNFELLLINDGSTDQSGVICDQYALQDARIQVFHQQNAGVSAARNLGLDHVKGEWITFVDSDDTIDEEYLSNFNVNAKSADIYLQGTKYINRIEDNLLFENAINESLLTYNAFIIKLDKKGFFEGPCAKVFKRSIIDLFSIRFNENLSYGEDNLFVLQYLKECKTFSVSQYLGYNYYQNYESNSLSNKIHEFEKIQLYIDLTNQERIAISRMLDCNEYKIFCNELNNTRIFNSLIHLYINNNNTRVDFKNKKFNILINKLNFDYNILSKSKNFQRVYFILRKLRYTKKLQLIFLKIIKLVR